MSTDHSPRSFTGKVLLIAGVALLLVAAAKLIDLFVLLFGGIVVAATFRAMASGVEQLRVPRRWSLTLVILGLLVLGVGGLTLMGNPLAEQFQGLRERVPAATEAVMQWLQTHRLGVLALEQVETLREHAGPWAQRLAGVAGMTFGALGTAGLMIVLGIYLAADPRLYRDGFVRLVPVGLRGRVGGALDASGRALSRWLLGQAVSMLFVGAATAIGLALLGVPLALGIGVLSGLLAFIPFFGAIAGGLLAVLLAFMQGPDTVLYVVLLAIGIQQVEGHVLMPIVQRWAVDLPPVLGLAAAVMFGILFGLMGVLLATPLMVVTMVLVRKLYLEPMEGAAAAGSGAPATAAVPAGSVEGAA